MYNLPDALSTPRTAFPKIRPDKEKSFYILLSICTSFVKHFCRITRFFSLKTMLARDVLITRRTFQSIQETPEMKLIIAYIQPDRLNPVKQAL